MHVYTKGEAETILESFPLAKLDELLALARQAKRDSRIITDHKRIELPDGWAYRVYGNSVAARYLDGEQERRPFFVPNIRIEFAIADHLKAVKSVLERLPLGFCSCGKSMPFIRLLLAASGMIEFKGLRYFPLRVFGYSLGFLLSIWMWLRPIHQFSIEFNRHPDCL